MKAALAPVETGAAERTTGATQCGEVDLPIAEEALAGGSQFELVIAGDETTIAQRAGHPHTRCPGEMVVADPRRGERRSVTPAKRRGVARRDLHQILQHRRYLLVEEAKVAMAPLPDHLQDLRLGQLREMRAC